MEPLDELENYLREAAILDAYTFPDGGAHPDKTLLVLEGGVSVLAKPGRTEEATRMAHREVVAWVIARGLGWPELMGATVLRTVDEVWEGIESSVQVLWPAPDKDPPADSFRDEDTVRAAAFDAIIQHTDRNGHNWLGVPAASTGGTSRLKLVDHGYALDLPGQGQTVQSSFYELWKGRAMPDAVADGVRRLVADWPSAELADLLDENAVERAEARATHLAETGVLALGE